MSESILSQPPPASGLRIRYGPESAQFGDLRLPPSPGPHPVVVAIHGGYWRRLYDLEYLGFLCEVLTQHGFATWNIEYRRVGDPGGGWPGTFLDVAAAIDHVRELAVRYSLDLARVITLGHSAGGHLALWAAGRWRVPRDSGIYTPDPLPLCAAVALAGVVDLRRAAELGLSGGAAEELLGGAPDECPARYAAASPMELLPLGARQFVLHGTADDSVPFEISQRYAEAARARGDDIELILFPGVGHFELVDPDSEVWPRVLETVERAVDT